LSAGVLSAGVVAAICAATARLSREQARVAERILVELAGRAGVGEVVRAGRFLRAVLDPDGVDDESRADADRRFLVVRPTGSGGVEGEFRLPREAAARLRAWLDAYARPRVEGDERPSRVRNADALITLLDSKVTTELLVLVPAGSLPDDHPANTGTSAGPGSAADASDGDGDGSRSSPQPAGRDPGRRRHRHRDRDGAKGVDKDAGDVSGSVGDDTDGRAEDDASARDTNTSPSTEPSANLRGNGGRADGHGGGDGGRGDGGQSDRGQSDGGRGDGCGRCGHAPTRAAPGLLLATGQLLSVSDLHRLARTSSLTRMVMDADGQVLDMGRAVRLATGAQRRAVFARYATCWVDGCPLPAVLCQIDHADNWSDGGRTDLRMLGPACQFHNRDRYRHPDRYRRRREGKDRWAYTYTGRYRR
jgi:hypothetical protein